MEVHLNSHQVEKKQKWDRFGPFLYSMMCQRREGQRSQLNLLMSCTFPHEILVHQENGVQAYAFLK